MGCKGCRDYKRCGGEGRKFKYIINALLLRKEIVATMESVAVGMANENREAVDRAITNACSDSGKVFVERIKENLR